jgi:hypothetical protein
MVKGLVGLVDTFDSGTIVTASGAWRVVRIMLSSTSVNTFVERIRASGGNGHVVLLVGKGVVSQSSHISRPAALLCNPSKSTRQAGQSVGLAETRQIVIDRTRNWLGMPRYERP